MVWKMANDSKKELLLQGSILAVAGIIVKLIGFLYRIPMANMLGEVGNGLYGVAFGIYNIILTLSCSSLPLGLSKLISQYEIKKEYRSAYRLFRNSLILAMIVGGIFWVLIYYGADFLEMCYAKPGLAKPLRIVAPTTFVMAILGVVRGFFQGKNTMIPSAVSQIIEQIMNAIISIVAVMQFMRVYQSSADVFAYGAAGGIMGTLCGALSAFAFLLVLYLLYRPGYISRVNRSKNRHVASDMRLNKLLLMTLIPISLSQAAYQLSGTLDDLIFGNILNFKGLAVDFVTAIQGVYSTQYNLLINIPIAFASSLAVSIVPSIVASKERHDRRGIFEKVNFINKFVMVLTIPSVIGFMVLARPIISLIFAALTEHRDLSVHMLQIGSVSIVFYSLASISTAILQSLNKMREPIVNAFIGLVVHLIFVCPLLIFTEMNAYILVVGNIIFPLVICVLNERSLNRELHIHKDVKRTYIIPIIASLIMGIIVFLVYWIVDKFIGNTIVSVVVPLIIGVCSYFFFIFAFHCFSLEELYDLPMGRTIARFTGRFYR